MAAHGCDINERAYENGKTFLHEACLHGEAEWVELLMEHGALATLQCLSKRDALDYAKTPKHGKLD